MISPGSLQSPIGPSLVLDRPGYLSATSSNPHPFCGNAEGWGPISKYRYDLTPCFLDVWISSVAAFGILFGAGALVYLLRSCRPQPVSKNWHFYAKLVSLAIAVLSYITLTCKPVYPCPPPCYSRRPSCAADTRISTCLAWRL